MFRRLFTKLLAWQGKLKEESPISLKPDDVEKHEGNTLIEVSTPQDMVAKLEELMEKGNYAACFDLGQLYYLGDKGVQKDIHCAMSYFKEAADNGIAMAAYQMGRIYETGCAEDLPADQLQSFKWYARAAKEGLPEAENNLGSCYFFGRGVDVNYEKAFLLYKSSAEKGNNEAEMNVGICYAAGKGVKQDYALAYTWWKKAAEQGHVKAMVNLATCYEWGSVPFKICLRHTSGMEKPLNLVTHLQQENLNL